MLADAPATGLPLTAMVAMALLGAPAVASEHPAADCPVERAQYELRVADEEAMWRIDFVPGGPAAGIASDLHLRLTTPQRVYWFRFHVSQGYSGISVFPVTDPGRPGGPRDLLGPSFGSKPDGRSDPDVLGALSFLSFDADLVAAFVPPMEGEPAPPWLLLPELGRALWYEAAALTDDPSADPTADRDPMPRGMFRHVGCRPDDGRDNDRIIDPTNERSNAKGSAA